MAPSGPAAKTVGSEPRSGDANSPVLVPRSGYRYQECYSAGTVGPILDRSFGPRRSVCSCAMTPDRTVLVPDRLVDVRAGEVLRGRAVIVEGDRIEAVIAAADVPDGPRRIDLAGSTLLPGLLDLHSHLAGEEEKGQGYASLVMRSGAQEAIVGVRNARLRPGGRVHDRPRRGVVPRVHRRGDPGGDRAGLVPRAPDALRGRLRDVPGRRRGPDRAGGRRGRGRPARVPVRRHQWRRPDAVERPADPALRGRLHQDPRDRRRAHERHAPRDAGVHRGRDPRGRGGVRAPRHVGGRARPRAPRASCAPCAPASARSSTPR